MKKLLLAAVLGLAALIQAPRTASASGAFGLFTCGSCSQCGCGVCIRPYNAFSPVLCGSICVDNCFPFCGPRYGGCGACGCGLPPGPMMPMAYGPMMAPGPMMADPFVKPMPAPASTKGTTPPAPLPAVPTSTETPNPMPKGPTTAGMYPGMLPYGMIQPVGYYPMYYPAYGYGYGYGYGNGYGYTPMMPNGYGYYNPWAQQPAN